MSPFWVDGLTIAVHDANGKPYEIEWQGTWRPVTRTNRNWRVHTFWWQSELWRHYWEVAMDDTMGVVYHDLLGGAWHLERIYA